MVLYAVILVFFIIGIIISFFSKKHKIARIISAIILLPSAILMIIIGLTMIGLIPVTPWTAPLLP